MCPQMRYDHKFEIISTCSAHTVIPVGHFNEGIFFAVQFRHLIPLYSTLDAKFSIVRERNVNFLQVSLVTQTKKILS